MPFPGYFFRHKEFTQRHRVRASLPLLGTLIATSRRRRIATVIEVCHLGSTISGAATVLINRESDEK